MTSTDTNIMYTVRLDDGAEFGPATVDQLKAWAHEGRISGTTMLATDDGSPSIPARNFSELDGHLNTGNERVATIIPWRNKCALIGYYLGIFGLIPVLGAPLSLGGIVLGILGLRHWKRNHRAHGLAHSRVPLACGIIVLALTTLLLLLPHILEEPRRASA